MSRFVTYDIKNGVEYGKVCYSKRNGKKVTKTYMHLSHIIDKEKPVKNVGLMCSLIIRRTTILGNREQGLVRRRILWG